MYDYNFKRVEEKYLLQASLKEKFLFKISDYIDKDKFFISNIHNIWVDTDNNDLFINLLDKPLFKNKFRARYYGEGNEVFLETKIKYNGIVSKRRFKLQIDDFNQYMKGNLNIDNQIFKEIDYYFKYYNLKPVIYIAYDRESYKGKNSDLKITFDSNLRSRRNDLVLKKSTKMDNYFDEDYYIMEIKSVLSMPMWLVRILSELNNKPVSFSKYGKIYEKERGMIYV